MKVSVAYYALLMTTAVIYFSFSKVVFDKVYTSSTIVIDELFHIKQGQEFCNRNFSYWDPKITTLPGLYIVSTAVLGTYFKCNTYNLRFVNLLASCINFVLFSSILKFIYGNRHESQTKIVLQALNLSILPPLYFFSHVYYTDTLSLTFLLAYFRLCLVNKYKIFILLLALGSILMRQTNVVWVAMVLGHKVCDILIRSSRVFGNKDLSNVTLSKQSLIAQDIDSSKLKRYYGIKDFILALKYHLKTCFLTFFKFLTLHDCLILSVHCIVLITFIGFVIANGSIVVGDKKAHEAILHIPQVFYFLLFYGLFGLPYVIAKLLSTLKMIFSNKIIALLLAVLFVLIVHFDTVVHPYLLADNRHYTFYIWNRWYGKYSFAIYASVPVYIFLLFSLYDNLKEQNCISFLLPYSVSLFLVVALQKMIEVRYFLVPYIVLRLRFVRPSLKMIIFEFAWYVALNAVTFYVFFTKEITWKDFDYPQRIIW